jgi:MFS family permease
MSWLAKQYPALRNARFVVLLLGGFISSVGEYFNVVALSLVLYAATGDASALSLLWIVRIAVRIFTQHAAGALVDRWNQRTIIIACILGELVAASILALTRPGILWIALVCVGVFQLCDVLYGPAMAAAQPRIVTSKQLQSANALSNAVFSLSGLIGPALAGVAYIAQGPQALFAANAASYLFFLLPVVFLMPPLPATARRPEPLWTSVLLGIRYTAANSTCLKILGGFAIVSLTIRLVDIILVPLADTWRAAGMGYGTLLSALTAGGLVGALLAPRIVPLETFRYRIGWVFASAGLPTSAIAIWPYPITVLVAMFLLGVALDIFMVSSMTTLTHVVPLELRGRMFAGRSFVFALAAIPGLVVTKPLIPTLGPAGFFWIFSALFSVGALMLMSVRSCSGPRIWSRLSPPHATSSDCQLMSPKDVTQGGPHDHSEYHYRPQIADKGRA